ncbi:hypothetical protein FACS1894189_5410 [Planctomycetales bacterium]|nr:hypothetical protein FACS1894189_5410 [Planctomycetales bacterium]
MLSTGRYSLFVYAENNTVGNFTLIISQEQNTAAVKTGYDTLVQAAVHQQLSTSGWAYQVSYYNKLLAGTAYAGAASAKSILKSYPEVDANSDGKVNSADLTLAEQLVAGLVPPATISQSSVVIVNPDTTPPMIIPLDNTNVTLPTGYTAVSVNNLNFSGNTVTLPNNQGTIIKNGNTLTFIPGTAYQALSGNETQEVSFSLKTQKNGIEYSTPITFIVTGINDAPYFTSTKWEVSGIISNDQNNPVKTFEIGLTATDPDTSDQDKLIYSLAKNDYVTFDAATKKFSLDTSKLADRNAASQIKVEVTVSDEKASATKILTINLVPAALPTIGDLVIETAETQSGTNTVTPGNVNGFELSYSNLPNGLILSKENGKVKAVFTPDDSFKSLAAGEVQTIETTYTLTDSLYGLTTTGNIFITVHGEATAATPAEQAVTINKTDSIDKITVSKDDLLENWILPDGIEHYTVDNVKLSLGHWSGSGENPFDVSKLGTVGMKDGNIFFEAADKIFEQLGEDQWATFDLLFDVADEAGNHTAGVPIQLTINGTNNVPVLTLKSGKSTEDEPIVISYNPASDAALVVPVTFEASDTDWNDQGSLRYSIDEISAGKGFQINENTGAITIAKSDFAKLVNETTKITVTLNDGHTAVSESVFVYVKSQSEPVPVLKTVDNLSLYENDAVKQIDLNEYIDKRDGHQYTVNPPVFVSAEDAEKYSGCILFENGIFNFNPNNRFNFLAANEILTLTFQYNVSDTGFDACVSADGTFNIVITGVNNVPVWNGTNISEEINEGGTKTITGLLHDWSDADHGAALSIANIELTGIDSEALITLAELQVLSLAEITDENEITVDATNEIFRKLGTGDSITLTFTYTVSDGIENVTGTFAVTVNGVNNLPVIDEITEKTISATITRENQIVLGQYTATDSDRNSTITWSATVVDEEDSELSNPGFAFVGNQLVLNNPATLGLEPGKSKTFTIKLIANDGEADSTPKYVTVTVSRQTLPIIEITDTGFNESAAGTQLDTSIIVTRAGEADSAWYDKPTIQNVSIAGTNLTQETINNLFTIIGNETDGYSLQYVGAANLFDFLAAGETLTIMVQVTVNDKIYDVSQTAIWTLTITGEGSPHTTEAEWTGSDTFWGNKIGAGTEDTTFEVSYTNANDADWNEAYQYLLDSVETSGLDTQYIDTVKALIGVDSAGQITLKKFDWSTIPQQDFTITVTVKSQSINVLDTNTAAADVILNVKFAEAPKVTIANVDHTEGNEESASQKIDVDLDKNSEGYSIGKTIQYTGQAIEDIDPSSFAKMEDGNFVFAPGNTFDYLTEGETLTLTYQITVLDNTFNVSTAQTVTVNVHGRNSVPVLKAQTEEQIQDWTAHLGGVIDLGNIADLVDDTDKTDTEHQLVSINGTAVVLNDWFAVNQLGEFYYDGTTLQYKAVGELLETFQHGKITPQTFAFVVKDKYAESESGNFVIGIIGTNKQPKGKPVDPITVEEGSLFTININDIATDQNTGDKLRFYQVNGHDFGTDDEPNNTFRMKDGTTVTRSKDGQTLTVDTSTRYVNMQVSDSETWYLNITAADDSNAGDLTAISVPISVKVTVNGVDDAPMMPAEQVFGIDVTGFTTSNLVEFNIDFIDPDTSISQYDFAIDGINTYKVTQDDENPLLWYFKFKPGYVAESPLFFNITATHKTDSTKTAASIIKVYISEHTPPIVAVDESFKLTVSSNETHNTDDWYEVANVRYTGTEPLPADVQFSYDSTNKQFVIDTKDAFVYLGSGESVTLTFEVTVRDTEYFVDTKKTITVVVTGENDDPVSIDYTASHDLRVGDTEGIRFYLKDLATDPDKNDTLTFNTVDGQPITLGGNVTLSNGSGNVSYYVDKDGAYLLFEPVGTICEALKHNAVLPVSFNYAVSDGTSTSESTVKLQVIGTNKPPKFNTSATVIIDENALPTVIDPATLATDPNGDSFHIVSVTYNGETFSTGGVTLSSGATLYFDAEGRLIYDPSTRTVNLSAGSFANEDEFSITLADDSEAGNTQSAGTVTVKVRGTNEVPTAIQTPETNVQLDTQSFTVKITLADYFKDNDQDDKLSFSLDTTTDSRLTSATIENGILTLQFAGFVYSSQADLSDLVLGIRVDDEHEIIPMPFTVHFTNRYTAALAVLSEPVAESNLCNVSVWAEILENVWLTSQTQDITGVQLTLQYDPTLCEVLGIPSRYEQGVGFIEINVDNLDNQLAKLIEFNAKALSDQKPAFRIKYVEFYRNGEKLDASQIRLDY